MAPARRGDHAEMVADDGDDSARPTAGAMVTGPHIAPSGGPGAAVAVAKNGHGRTPGPSSVAPTAGPTSSSSRSLAQSGRRHGPWSANSPTLQTCFRYHRIVDRHPALEDRFSQGATSLTRGVPSCAADLGALDVSRRIPPGRRSLSPTRLNARRLCPAGAGVRTPCRPTPSRAHRAGRCRRRSIADPHRWPGHQPAGHRCRPRNRSGPHPTPAVADTSSRESRSSILQ